MEVRWEALGAQTCGGGLRVILGAQKEGIQAFLGQHCQKVSWGLRTAGTAKKKAHGLFIKTQNGSEWAKYRKVTHPARTSVCPVPHSSISHIIGQDKLLLRSNCFDYVHTLGSQLQQQQQTSILIGCNEILRFISRQWRSWCAYPQPLTLAHRPNAGQLFLQLTNTAQSSLYLWMKSAVFWVLTCWRE